MFRIYFPEQCRNYIKTSVNALEVYLLHLEKIKLQTSLPLVILVIIRVIHLLYESAFKFLLLLLPLPPPPPCRRFDIKCKEHVLLTNTNIYSSTLFLFVGISLYSSNVFFFIV